MKINDFFEEAFYINLDKRNDRRVKFENELERVGLSGFVKRFSACIDATNLPRDDYNRHRACGKSHHHLIQYAKNNNLKNILIFEDDAYFYDEGELPGIKIIESALDSLSKIENWDVFYLGGLVIDPEIDLITNNLAKVNTVLTAHAWSINHTGYDKLLPYVPETDSAIDGWVGQRNHIIKYIAYPLAVPQREGESDLDANGINPGIGPYFHSFSKPLKNSGNIQLTKFMEELRNLIPEYNFYNLMYAINCKNSYQNINEFLDHLMPHVPEPFKEKVLEASKKL